jgi:hypothetical protein
MTIAHFQVPRERITLAMERSGAAHLRPVMIAVRDYGCGLCVVPHGGERFAPPTNKPTILIIGDDLTDCLGPNGFHQKSLRRYIKRCRSAAIVSCEPLVAAYAAATAAAVVLRRDVLIVETRLEQEENWRAFITQISPDIPVLVATVRPEGGVQ